MKKLLNTIIFLVIAMLCYTFMVSSYNYFFEVDSTIGEQPLIEKVEDVDSNDAISVSLDDFKINIDQDDETFNKTPNKKTNILEKMMKSELLTQDSQFKVTPKKEILEKIKNRNIGLKSLKKLPVDFEISLPF